ncbi:hypothetical protein BJ875DRAFT_203512 [Amylocarpus encephaloides]|uniref:Uncharacterized protein n=1 Tax=Amylocarpus encephaloides TaxID=45428 RepID=A0A9P7YPH9_9HELO|nr:hypothetical protein BJ875DRAFT_203512 [Amylocarpus encephaloides]
MAPIPNSLDSVASVATAALSNIAKRISSSNNLLQRVPVTVPTPTTASVWTRILAARQSTNSIIPTTYGSINSGPPPGTVVGIVLGSVAGFLLILWLFYTCLNFGQWGTSDTYIEETITRDGHRRKSHRGSQRSRRVSETVEVRRSHSAVRIPSPRRETIIVEEHTERRAPSRRGSDEVVVIEEHSPPRRKKSHRDRRDDLDSGFRTVDPSAFAGVVGGNSRRGSSRRGYD